MSNWNMCHFDLKQFCNLVFIQIKAFHLPANFWVQIKDEIRRHPACLTRVPNHFIINSREYLRYSSTYEITESHYNLNSVNDKPGILLSICNYEITRKRVAFSIQPEFCLGFPSSLNWGKNSILHSNLPVFNHIKHVCDLFSKDFAVSISTASGQAINKES